MFWTICPSKYLFFGDTVSDIGFPTSFVKEFPVVLGKFEISISTGFGALRSHFARPLLLRNKNTDNPEPAVTNRVEEIVQEFSGKMVGWRLREQKSTKSCMFKRFRLNPITVRMTR